ncbi:MAG: hypothetical protein ABIQ60_04690, partial [Burkholderiaceae bacterium]
MNPNEQNASRPNGEPETDPRDHAAHGVNAVPAHDSVDGLDGEPGIPSVTQPARINVSRKGVIAVGLFAMTLAAFSAVSIQRALTGTKHGEAKLAGDKP